MKSNALNELASALRSQLGKRAVRSEPEQTALHAHDWSSVAATPPALVVMPDSTQAVATALRLCNEHGQKVVVQGGLTGLAGGATPQVGEVAISLSRLNSIERIDELGGTAIVESGVTLQRLQEHVESMGWAFPLDLGARGSCQLGGNAATNAGGNRVVRYGTMRNLVLGMEVALPDGSVLNLMNEVTKNTTGIDLKQLFIGAEGTLGVITRLALKLSPLPRATQTALCALPSFEAAGQLLKQLRANFPGLSAFELMWDSFVEAAIEVSSTTFAFAERHPLYALIEIQGGDEDHLRHSVEEFLGVALEQGGISDAVVASSLADTQRLWAQRESISELLSVMKPSLAFDIGLPLPAMGNLVNKLQSALCEQFPQSRHLFFGHLGDGNLHVLSGPYTDPTLAHEAEALIYELTVVAGGCISAEHGIGVLKRPFLGLNRTPRELELMAQIKHLLDPAAVLNAGRIFEPVGH